MYGSRQQHLGPMTTRLCPGPRAKDRSRMSTRSPKPLADTDTVAWAKPRASSRTVLTGVAASAVPACACRASTLSMSDEIR
jgi:hypothetical protein